MTAAPNTSIPRRTLLAGGLAVLGLGAAALLAFKVPALLGPHYAPTPFDDLLSQLPDRENATRLGQAVLARQKNFDARNTASLLRARLKNRPLGDVLSAELQQGRVVEVRGWILPETMTTLCALAAKAA
jgi:hypothetical protein